MKVICALCFAFLVGFSWDMTGLLLQNLGETLQSKLRNCDCDQVSQSFSDQHIQKDQRGDYDSIPSPDQHVPSQSSSDYDSIASSNPYDPHGDNDSTPSPDQHIPNQASGDYDSISSSNQNAQQDPHGDYDFVENYKPDNYFSISQRSRLLPYYDAIIESEGIDFFKNLLLCGIDPEKFKSDYVNRLNNKIEIVHVPSQSSSDYDSISSSNQNAQNDPHGHNDYTSSPDQHVSNQPSGDYDSILSSNQNAQSDPRGDYDSIPSPDQHIPNQPSGVYDSISSSSQNAQKDPHGDYDFVENYKSDNYFATSKRSRLLILSKLLPYYDAIIESEGIDFFQDLLVRGIDPEKFKSDYVNRLNNKIKNAQDVTGSTSSSSTPLVSASSSNDCPLTQSWNDVYISMFVCAASFIGVYSALMWLAYFFRII